MIVMRNPECTELFFRRILGIRYSVESLLSSWSSFLLTKKQGKEGFGYLQKDCRRIPFLLSAPNRNSQVTTISEGPKIEKFNLERQYGINQAFNTE